MAISITKPQPIDPAISTDQYVLPFTAISAADLPKVGGKGANLGEMTRAGFPVPPGFCVTTSAFRRFVENCADMDKLYGALDAVRADDLDRARAVGEQVRSQLANVPIPPDVADAVLGAWRDQGENDAYAVRSSATAEDLPDASFAGQQDTYLNIRGADALLENVRRCWISLFTDRAILYRVQNHFDHRDVLLSVVVQRMVLPQVSGILFTADPVSGNRCITTIDASYGLGEALVSGIVSADLYKVDKRLLREVDAIIADKQLAIRPLPAGGTVQETLTGPARTARVLTAEQAIALTQIGNRIESHYGKPQDIEWALADDDFYIVQSRPITSLYPLPAPQPTDGAPHFYMSFSHAQVMTDPMPPMGLSVWRLLFPFGKEAEPEAYNPLVTHAGGRLYVDMGPMLARALPRRIVPTMLENADPLIAAAIKQLLTRPEFRVEKMKPQRASVHNLARWLRPLLFNAVANLFWRKPEGRAAAVNRWSDDFAGRIVKKLTAAQRGADRIAAARTVLGQAMMDVLPELAPNIAAGFMARALLARLLGNRVVSADIDALFRGLSGNVTTDMDLEVGDLADVARRSPALVDYLTSTPADQIWSGVRQIEGGADFLTALERFLDRYGMRGASEIDITRKRWRDDPTPLLQVIVGNLRQPTAGAHRAQHAAMTAEGEAAANRLVAAAAGGLFGPMRQRIVRRLTRVLRNLMAVREHPKFLLIQVLGEVRIAILEAGAILQKQQRLAQIEDVWFLDLNELIDVLHDPSDDPRPRVAQRQADHARFWSMKPPRVMTSDGEIITVTISRDDLPEGALAGNPVSAGVVEGVAHVVTDPHTQVLSPGEILVAPFTDPGWTPLFINAAGLVMEVGGMMTHGSVVAREYGIPAVVGVLDATRRIETGQRIRVHGDQGYVEILSA
ncbi:MAG: phosphoenolpyruvate synthase [Caldilineaceae bacterium]